MRVHDFLKGVGEFEVGDNIAFFGGKYSLVEGAMTRLKTATSF